MKKFVSILTLCILLCGCQDTSEDVDTSPTIVDKQEMLCEYLKIDKNANQYILTVNEKEALEKGISKETYHAFTNTLNSSNENIRKAISEGRAISLVLSNEISKDIQNINFGNGIEYDPDTLVVASRGNQSFYYISISNGRYSKSSAKFAAPANIATQVSVSGARSGESIVIRCNNGKTAYGSTIQLYIYGSSLTEVKYWWNTKSNNEAGGNIGGGGGTGGGAIITPPTTSEYILNIKPGELDIKAGQEIYVGLDGTITSRASETLYNWDFEIGGVAPNGYGGISFTEQ